MGDEKIEIPELEEDLHFGEEPESIQMFHLDGTPAQD